ncbi:hypothetical protein [Micromonospora aurantiaca (nom. illeg.)]|uniref:hypothetical protein n=1 Tax=Micromonospora aurantiaca (nom. illeg.) TaxID=47850 RepID=UPI0033D38FB3
MAAEEAREQIRLMLADKGRARFSRWTRHRGEMDPNPAYDPAVTMAQVAAMPPVNVGEQHQDDGAAEEVP